MTSSALPSIHDGATASTRRPTDGAIVSAIRVGRRFETPRGPVDALRDVTLSFPEGSFTVIVGPSGCGKSTLLRMIGGLDSPTSGDLVFGNGRASGSSPTNALVFQGRSLFPWLTLRQNVAYGLRLRGSSRADRHTRADELLQLVGLLKFARAYPHQVSEGMRQRVAIARALAVDPDILLMDEPFGALDEQTRLILQEELLRIWEATGKTVIFVTHSLDEALMLADTIVVMSAQPGTIRTVFDVPFNRPRLLTAVRSDPQFAELFTRTWDILRTEVTTARAQQEEEIAR
jgi:NitT/TauT family transport system ATP-binding protein